MFGMSVTRLVYVRSGARQFQCNQEDAEEELDHQIEDAQDDHVDTLALCAQREERDREIIQSQCLQNGGFYEII